ncbi:MAG: A/G-specific adenine glycosylase [Pirellulaceae bacterium]|nr:A/G-specific adenine glycosylase [Pirellulaceae bacterium]
MTNGLPQTLKSTADLLPFRRALLAWYHKHHRPLPWRQTHDPYAIWVSEIMLQQTQVTTVIEYYERFLGRFPTVRSLADAPEQEVLTLWAGLGYYRRARQMHVAAKEIVQQQGDVFPATFNEVRALPGVGRYTAGAIVSFAYGHRAPILEANTLRLYSRLIGLREDPKSASSQQLLWRFADHLLPKTGANIGKVNQALIELGSLVCTPKRPNCAVCPVKRFCATYRGGLQAEIPRLPAPQTYTPLHHALVVVHRGKKTLMRQNPAGRWWAGLWDFPRIDLTELGWHQEFDRAEPHLMLQVGLVEQAMQQALGLELREATSEYLTTVKHGVTRYRIALHCFRAMLRPAARLPPPHTWQWVDLAIEPQLPFTSTAQKLRRWLLTQ